MDRKQAFRAIMDSIRHDHHASFVELITEEPEYLRMTHPMGTWLHVAASYGRLDTVQTLLEMGLEVNKRAGPADGSALRSAASKGHLNVVEFLFQKGATFDTSAPDRNPLFAAIYGGHLPIAQFLIDQGIDTKIKYTTDTMDGMGALAFARERGQADLIELLS